MDPVDRLHQEADHLLAVGRVDDARVRAVEALGLDPGDHRSLTLLARVHLAADEFDDAVDVARRSVAVASSPAALHVLAIAHRRLAQWNEATAAVDAAIALVPTSAPLHVTRSLILTGPGDVPRESIDAAVVAARRAAALDPESAAPDHALAVAAIAGGNLPAAADHLHDALTKMPDWADAHRLLGWVRTQQGMTKLASRHFASAGMLEPTSDSSLEALRGLSRPQTLTLGAGVPMVVGISLLMIPAGVAAVAATFALGVAAVGAFARFRFRTAGPDTSRLTADAARIVEADYRLRGSR